MEQLIRIGMDTSKTVFQLHGVDAAEQPCLLRKLRRRAVVPFSPGLRRFRLAFRRVVVRIIGRARCRRWAMRWC